MHVIVHECLCTSEHILCIYSGFVSMYEFGVYLFIIIMYCWYMFVHVCVQSEYINGS